MSEAQARIDDSVTADVPKSGGVLPRNRRTDSGLIPEDWDVLPIGQIANVVRGASPRPIDSHIWFDEQSTTGWLRIADVTATVKYLDATSQSLSLAGVSNSRFVRRGSLVMSICATVGRPVITRKDVCIHDGFVVFDKLQADGEYMYYVLSNLEQDWSKHGQTGSQMNLNTGLINSTSVPLPSLIEQRAIAHALSDVDELLGSLNALIGKKTATKQAVVQQLLTGKTRLPGFNESWKAHRLCDLGVFSKGNGISRDDLSVEGLACVRYGELYTSYSNYIVAPVSRVRPDVAEAALPIKIGDLLFASSGETAEEIGRCAAYFGEEPAFAGGDIIVLTPVGHDSRYLGHLMNHSVVTVQKARLAQGDAVVHISARNLGQVKVTLPALDEQRTIATVLAEMDAEIVALEQRRDKTRDIRSGMIQQLLTGRVRLVDVPLCGTEKRP